MARRSAHADAALLDYVLTSDDGKVIDSSEGHGPVAVHAWTRYIRALQRR